MTPAPLGMPDGEHWEQSTTLGGTEFAVGRQPPGHDVGHRAFHEVLRLGPNDWGLLMGDVQGPPEELGAIVDEVIATLRAAATRAFLPSVGLRQLDRVLTARGARGFAPHPCAVILARIELDACGAWVTLAGAGHPRPIVVRQAGWVDVRGHVSGPLGIPGAVPADDRVGLGPGDAITLCSTALTSSTGADGSRFGDHVLPDVLIDCVGQSANAVAGRILAGATEFGGDRLHDEGLALVLRVPESVKSDGPAWVSRSTGIPEEELHLPGYPLGDAEPEAWRRRPMPPREALIRLAPEPPSIPALRRLLRRLLLSWRMDVETEGDIELLATEVATSAFSRTASPVTTVVRYTGPVVRVEVGDGARALPRRTRRGVADLSGHRLALVESLASDWGISTTATGTRIWFEVPVAQPLADHLP